MWGATLSTRRSYENQTISIHAPRVGSDPAITGTGTSPLYFNPRSPCGERLPEHMIDAAGVVFQSTLPVWGATISLGYMLIVIRISIHAPRVGSDLITFSSRIALYDFNPRSPCGERPGVHVQYRASAYFNPRSPCGERPEQPPKQQLHPAISIHAPRVGSDSDR